MVDHLPKPAYFLKLPLELREQIYKDVLTNPSNGPHLILTCREICNEAYKFLFQRPLTFRGQSAFYQWLRQVSPQHLHYVAEMTLEIHDADLRPLISQSASSSKGHTPPRLQAWDLYKDDLEELRRSTAKLDKLKRLTVRALSESRSHLYREFLAKFLASLSEVWPKLQGLTLEGNFHRQNLSFLSSLSELQALTFDGFSSTPSSEMATLLSRLNRLESLSLISQCSLLTPTTHVHSGFTSKMQSFTKDVLFSMNSLASFSVTEQYRPASAPTLFFTPEMLKALHNHSTLKRLTIRLSQRPDTPTLEALDAFLTKSNIERLELDWPDLDAAAFETHELLPRSLKWFWVRIPSLSAAFDILYLVLDGLEGGDLKGLEHVVLIRRQELELKETLEEVSQTVEGRSNVAEEDAGVPRGESDISTGRTDRGTENAGTESESGTEEEVADENTHQAETNIDAVPKAVTGVKTGADLRKDSGAGCQFNECENDDEPFDYDSSLPDDEEDVASAIRCLKARGVQVLWCIDKS